MTEEELEKETDLMTYQLAKMIREEAAKDPVARIGFCIIFGADPADPLPPFEHFYPNSKFPDDTSREDTQHP